MPSSVFIETSIVSYLGARPSRDLITAAHQSITRDWWDLKRTSFDLRTSQLVLDEAGEGDPTAAAERVRYLHGIPLLDLTPEVTGLAQTIIAKGHLPAKAAIDAIHIAVSTVHRVDYLLTWNCAHIANAEVRKSVRRLCSSLGLEMPTICTPEELIGA